MKKIKPSCSIGYTESDILAMGIDFEDFLRWMYGQTVAFCDGKIFNHETKQYEDVENPHGTIYYVDDVERYLCTRKFKS